MNNFIPSYHITVAPEDKLLPEWALTVVTHSVHNGGNRNLLAGKNVAEIDGYASGNFDLTPFKRMFKSEAKKLSEQQRANPNYVDVNNNTAIGVEYSCIDLLSEKLASGTAIIQKIPVEISCVAVDPLAIEKKKSDVNFLKNKPEVEAELEEVAERMNLGKIDLGSTKNSSVEYSDSPFGLDLSNPEELDIFVNLIYSLKVESSFETILQYFLQLKKINQLKLLEIKDQFKYAISVHEAFQNDLTGLPDVEYIFPGEMEVPFSRLPDYSDNAHRIRYASLTPLQLYDRFASEIGSEDDLDFIINASKTEGGYCACNGIDPQPYSNFDFFKVQLKYVEVKTVDWIGVKKANKKSKFKTFTTDAKQATEKIWVQNTIGFWWLVNTRIVFGIHKLPYSKRTKGKESYQNFSTNIYKSQERSAVEQSIGECKKAQIADIKLQHTVIKSKPDGVYIDLKYLRGALEGLKDESDTWNMNRLLTLAMEQNVVLGDTEGFDGKNEGQFKAVEDLPGGLKASIVGYMNIIAAANINISRITGVNQQLTGQSANEEGLVGLQKLLINASINALHYVNEGIEFQMQALFSTWASIIQQAVAEGGKVKEAIKNVIGTKKVNIIDGLDDIALHEIGIFVKIKQREEERQLFRNKLTQLESERILTATDVFMVNNIQNPKDQWAFIAVKEQQYLKREDKKRQENFEHSQAMIAQQGENSMAVKNAEIEGNIKEVYAKGDVDAQKINLAGQLGISLAQLEGIIKKDIQQERNRGNVTKTVVGVEAKSNAKQQEAMV